MHCNQKARVSLEGEKRWIKTDSLHGFFGSCVRKFWAPGPIANAFCENFDITKSQPAIIFWTENPPKATDLDQQSNKQKYVKN